MQQDALPITARKNLLQARLFINSRVVNVTTVGGLDFFFSFSFCFLREEIKAEGGTQSEQSFRQGLSSKWMHEMVGIQGAGIIMKH